MDFDERLRLLVAPHQRHLSKESLLQNYVASNNFIIAEKGTTRFSKHVQNSFDLGFPLNSSRVCVCPFKYHISTRELICKLVHQMFQYERPPMGGGVVHIVFFALQLCIGLFCGNNGRPVCTQPNGVCTFGFCFAWCSAFCTQTALLNNCALKEFRNAPDI